MHAILRLEVAEGIVAVDFDGHRLDAGIVALDEVLYGGLVAVVLGIAHIEALQLFGPVLGLGAARTGVDLEDAVQVILFTLEHVLQLDVLEEVHRLLVLRIDLLFTHQFLLVEFEGGGEFVDVGLHVVVCLNPGADALDHLHLLLSLLLVVPESGHLCAELLFFELDLLVLDVEIAVQVGQTVLCGLQLFYCNHRKSAFAGIYIRKLWRKDSIFYLFFKIFGRKITFVQ